jgi:protein-disulfide isomerase
MGPTFESRSALTIPVAIIVGFALVAVAIFFTVGKTETVVEQNDKPEETSGTLSSTPKAVDETDYIRGNPNAPILLIEYSDYDCPFCKDYHETLTRIMSEYGVTGKVAWVYRQFPIAQLHPNSPRVSEAALCVGKIGGNDAFWKFTDLIFQERDIDQPTNFTKIPDYVTYVGVDKDQYVSCMDNGDTTEAVKTSIEDAFNIGARGTPYTVLVVGNQQAIISGAQPYDVVKGIIENLISQLDGTFEAQQPPAENPQ